uniref:Uncharacterized protein n=1 Tax=uncultured bacterium contig00009 TaxID=1181501 RepID=A0A806JZV6_9BACT|nr:hypothetical protein [uncultured bacterium contig00009]
MITATLTPPAAAGGNLNYHALAVSLNLLTGFFCLLAGRFTWGSWPTCCRVPS